LSDRVGQCSRTGKDRRHGTDSARLAQQD
jgi:hypothetical protein